VPYAPPGFHIDTATGYVERDLPPELQGQVRCDGEPIFWDEWVQRSWNTGGYEIEWSYSDGDSCISHVSRNIYNGNSLNDRGAVGVSFWTDSTGKSHYKIIDDMNVDSVFVPRLNDDWKLEKRKREGQTLGRDGWKKRN
jgi:hypothetical protein